MYTNQPLYPFLDISSKLNKEYGLYGMVKQARIKRWAAIISILQPDFYPVIIFAVSTEFEPSIIVDTIETNHQWQMSLVAGPRTICILVLFKLINSLEH